MNRPKRLSRAVRNAIAKAARVRGQVYARGVAEQLTGQAEALLATGYSDELTCRVLGIRLTVESDQQLP